MPSPHRARRWPACLPATGSVGAKPGKTICLGLNYFDHAKAGGRDKPEYPWFFYRAKAR